MYYVPMTNSEDEPPTWVNRKVIAPPFFCDGCKSATTHVWNYTPTEGTPLQVPSIDREQEAKEPKVAQIVLCGDQFWPATSSVHHNLESPAPPDAAPNSEVSIDGNRWAGSILLAQLLRAMDPKK